MKRYIITISLSEEIYKQLEKMAIEEKRSLAQVARLMIENKLEKEKG